MQIIADSTDKNNLTKGGHLYKKTFQEKDDTLLLEPHLNKMGIFLYKRYRTNPLDVACLMPCRCHIYGGLCRYCIVLNTSVFHDLEDPRQDRFAFSTRITHLHEKEQWKRVFRHTVDEIEVRYRPGMEECLSSFFRSGKPTERMILSKKK